ncbi:MAG: adenylate/guanylate cyclase domain-containing protein [Acidimicrobiales bacterium]
MGAIAERDRVLIIADLANFTGSVAQLDDLAVAGLLDQWLTEASHEVTANGGDVVKYLGDGVLADFDADAGPDAVNCAGRLRELARGIGSAHGIDLDCGVSVHRAPVVECRFGPQGWRDLSGRGVLHCFRMGRGPGIRISEPVYRQLPNGDRHGWSKHRPPATYHWNAGPAAG